MDDAKNQLVERLKTATNILVTVSSSPSVDQLAACIGLTLWLNKVGKHATAVFSGDIPNALEFLQPEATIEKTTDSLRDFIIALDKSKADKLRYKVEDRVVKIFITPYRTSLSADDLEFSQGDFNVDAIVALGVGRQEDLDTAIISHGRILHDATVTTINIVNGGGLGSINWTDTSASSLSELAFEIGQSIDPSQNDPQIATALLTGIVAETNRFSNNKTTPNTMSVAAALMSSGANQQLVSSKLDEAHHEPAATPESQTAEETPEAAPKPDGTLEIEHKGEAEAEPEPESDQQPPEEAQQGGDDQAQESKLQTEQPQEAPEEKGENEEHDEAPDQDQDALHESTFQSRVIQPPSGSSFTPLHLPEDQNSTQNGQLSLPPVDQSQIEQTPPEETPTVITPDIPQAQPSAGPLFAAPEEPKDGQTLTQLEESVASPHLDSLRNQVEDALKSGPLPPPEPTEALNAVNVDLKPQPQIEPTDPMAFNPANFEVQETDNEPESTSDPNLPPSVPPPIVPPDFLPPAPPTQQ